MKWNPKTDKDAKFNVGTVHLKQREKGDTVKKSQDENAKVISLAIANKTTSSTPSQGKKEMEGYNFSYWQYIDTLVAWGGLAGEGLIVPTSADLIDAAHTNGVPVLGTIFFPPGEYGGKDAWLDEFLQKDADGALNTKWCAFGERGNWITVDLGKENIIKELRMSHAQSGGEAASMNTSEYTIEISKDGDNWTELSDVKGNSSAVSRDDLKYELARYVRVKVNKSEQGSGGATRIYEIEVLGLESNRVLVLDNKEALYQLNNTINTIETEYRNLGVVNSEFEDLLNKSRDIIDRVEVEIQEIVEAENNLISAFEILKNK